MAFYSMEPFGYTRDNIHSAMIASLIYNANRGKKSKPMDASDFMLRDEWQKREKDTADFLAGMRALAKPKGEK